MRTLDFRLESLSHDAQARVSFKELVLAGWTGRDTGALEHHIAELAALGVKPPSSVPLFYRVSVDLLTQESHIQVLGNDSSGEAEPVLFGYDGDLWLTVGSDHTDRRVEAYSVAVSKQMCQKPLASTAWRASEVLPHWDQLRLRSFTIERSARTLYQDGLLSAMRTPGDLLPRLTGKDAHLPDGVVISCGTLTAIGGVRPSTHFSVELEDPVHRRVLRHDYAVTALPVVA